MLYIVIFVFLIKIVISIFKGGLVKTVINLLVFITAVYSLFMILWGFNYNRLAFAEITNMNVQEFTKEDLVGLCEELIERSNELRKYVKEDENGVMILDKDHKDALQRSGTAYNEISHQYNFLNGTYGKPKEFKLSKLMSYMGIGGMYFPFTGEANINTDMPDFLIPFAATHEMAHQRGFAREDEANYIAYLTCSYYKDIDFQYSAAYEALLYSMNALAKLDYNNYLMLSKKYSNDLARDLEYNNNYWIKFDSKIEKISNKINDKYLELNGQEGVISYNDMVELLLMEYKQREKIKK